MWPSPPAAGRTPSASVPRGPLAHPPLAASGGFRLGEHNQCYRKQSCRESSRRTPAPRNRRRRTGRLPSIQGSPGNNSCTELTPPCSNSRPPLARPVRRHGSRQFDSPAVETNRRPHPAIIQHSLLAKTKRHPRPP